MAETPYLVDSNVLLRWVKPNHRDYPLIVSATDAILRHDASGSFEVINISAACPFSELSLTCPSI
jgi:hypothetical protein